MAAPLPVLEPKMWSISNIYCIRLGVSGEAVIRLPIYFLVVLDSLRLIVSDCIFYYEAMCTD